MPGLCGSALSVACSFSETSGMILIRWRPAGGSCPVRRHPARTHTRAIVQWTRCTVVLSVVDRMQVPAYYRPRVPAAPDSARGASADPSLQRCDAALACRQPVVEPATAWHLLPTPGAEYQDGNRWWVAEERKSAIHAKDCQQARTGA